MIEDGYGFCSNRWVLDTRIKNELPILLIISSMSAKTGEVFAKNKFFADLFDCTEVSISGKISKLEKLGYIEVEYEKRGCEVLKRIIRLKKFLTDDSKSFYSTVKKDFKDNNINNNNIKNKQKNENELLKEAFLAFWKEYPKKRAGSKEKAFKSYCQAIKEKRATVEKILETCKKYAQSEEVKKGFAKGCAAWLNDDRFNNEYEVKKEYYEW